MSRHIIYAISKIGIMAAIIMACLFAPSAYAQDTVKLSEEITIVEETPVLNSGNTAWLIVATILVLLMSIPGIALFYGGLVRQKNILSIIMQTLLIVGVVSILWVAFGYSWAFGTSFMESGNPLGAIIGGFDKAFLHGITINTLTTGDIPELTFVMFQCMFAIITPALILSICRKNQILRIHGIYYPLGNIGLLPDGTLGMGRRIPSANGSHRFCRWYGSAYQCRNFSPCYGDHAGEKRGLPDRSPDYSA